MIHYHIYIKNSINIPKKIGFLNFLMVMICLKHTPNSIHNKFQNPTLIKSMRYWFSYFKIINNFNTIGIHFKTASY